jgi:hypothetical protein
MPGQPGVDGLDGAAGFDAGQVIERGRDRVTFKQRAAAGLHAPVAILKRRVQHRRRVDADRTERDAAGGFREGAGEHQPGLADLGRADEQRRPLGDDAGHRVAQRREVLPIEPSTVTQPSEQIRLVRVRAAADAVGDRKDLVVIGGHDAPLSVRAA